MKSKIIYSLMILLICTVGLNLLYAQNLPSREKAFFFEVKIYSNNYNNKIDLYSMSFDKANYKNKKSDEFERKNCDQNILTIITNGVPKQHLKTGKK